MDDVDVKATAPSYDTLIEQALRASVRGWDFGWLRGRTSGGSLSWDYGGRAAALLPTARRLLDMDTGGGEFLSGLSPLPPYVVAMEGWQADVACSRLRALGVAVVSGVAERIPMRDSTFDVVLNRHGGLNAAEVARVLSPGGRLLTQQVGSRNGLELNEALGAPPPVDPEGWTLATAVDLLERHGLKVVDAREEMADYVFHDVGAVVFQLRAVSWQVRDFDVGGYERPLRALHERILAEGGFVSRDHRFLLEAVRPGGRR
jgi:SAM-dependent methyltransferase